MENNRNFPARQFHSLTFFAGLCIGITPVAQALAAEGQTNADDTLVVEASTPSLYAPQQSADPKFSRPVFSHSRSIIPLVRFCCGSNFSHIFSANAV